MGFPPGRQITVPTIHGASRDADATDTGVGGLVAHAAVGTTGWSLTHEPTGRCAAWWPDGTREQALACAAALGRLADWSSTDPSQVTTRPVCAMILAHGGLAPTRDPARWLGQDQDGDMVPVLITGARDGD